MKSVKMYMLLSIVLIATAGFSLTIKKADTQPCRGIVGDEPLLAKEIIPYLGGRGPGDQIGTTAYDYQANGGFCQRLVVDDYGQAHINWMWQDYPGQTMRYCAWNARFSDGSYYGETQASNSWSGYVQLDVTQDANPDNQRTAIAYHFDPGTGYYSWVDIDGGNLWGIWPNNPVSPQIADHIWPYVALAGNNNIILVSHGYPVPGDNHIYVDVTTDAGGSWTTAASVDSCATISQFVRASRNPGSQKVVVCWTKFITDSIASGQLDNNIWYMLSTDGGVTWGAPVNVTDYQPADTVRAYTDVNAIFDANDNLHIVWSGRKVDAGGYYVASKIFHWDEVSGNITVVNSPSTYYTEPGGWWIATASSPQPGGWRLPADQPQLVVDLADNTLYCLWHGNDDYNDGSAAGFFNGEFFGSVSFDGGATWSNYVNLTNTRSPGAGAGACDDEDYMTACPYVVNDSIFLTYIEDKDAGGVPQSEGTVTENPVRCWVMPTFGIQEHKTEVPDMMNMVVLPNPVQHHALINYTLTKETAVSLKVFDASGRVVKDFGTGQKTRGTYSVNMETNSLANGTYFAVLDLNGETISRTFIVLH